MRIQGTIRVVGLAFVLLSLSIVSYAQRGRDDDRRGRDNDRWEQLGRSYVDGRRDHDRIAVNRSESFRALLLEVRGGTIEFQRVVVHFDSGADHEIEIRDRIADQGRTRVIDLPGDSRRIRSVEFWYAKGRLGSRPYVNLLGQRGASRDSYDQRRRDSEYGWEVLGQAHVDGRNDHDSIAVERSESFRAIQLGIKGGAIEFQRVVVHFENGADHVLEIRQRIRAGDKTRVIDLPGDRRRIRSVEFWYSKERWSERPWVNLWGRR